MLSRLAERKEELPGVWSFLFDKPSGFDFTAGDYTELEIDYPPNGGRRWFSLSSSPGEERLQITFRLPKPHSEFKRRLIELKVGDTVNIAPPMGNFNLPLAPTKTLFVAVGIGVTPFRSMILDLTSKNKLKDWDIKMIHAARTDRFLFEGVFSRLGSNWIKTGTKPKIAPSAIKNLVPDTEERLVFLAGPEPVMQNLHTQLANNVPPSQLRLSYFPGYKAG